MPATTFTPTAHLGVIGYDSEYADMSNPQGAIFGEIATVSATVGNDMYNYRGKVGSEERAISLSALFKVQADRGTLDVTNSKEWAFDRTIYGSAGWSASDEAQMLDDDEVSGGHNLNLFR